MKKATADIAEVAKLAPDAIGKVLEQVPEILVKALPDLIKGIVLKFVPGKAVFDTVISFFSVVADYGKVILDALSAGVSALRSLDVESFAQKLFDVFKKSLPALLAFLIRWLKLDKLVSGAKAAVLKVGEWVKEQITKVIKLIVQQIKKILGIKDDGDPDDPRAGGDPDALDVKVFSSGAIQFIYDGHTYTIDPNGELQKCSVCKKVTDPVELKKLAAIIDKAKKVAAAKKAKGKYRGGRHGFTKGPTNDGLESHHMPAASINGLPRDEGPAIQMEIDDHRDTASHGSNPKSHIHRAKLEKLVKAGKFGEAIQLDIDDVRGQFPSKYDQAIREMIASLDPWMANGLKSTTI